MTGNQDPTRRAFLGQAAGAAGAVTASTVAGGAVAAAVSGCTGSGGHPAAGPSRIRPRSSKAENSLPGERHWWIKHVGAPDAIQGFTGQASVLQGDPVTLFASTTAREFRVTALRMGWYGGLLARRVWESGWIRGHVQRRHSLSAGTRTVSCDWQPSLTMQTADWPAGTYLLRLDASSGAQRYVPMTVRSFSTAGKIVIKNAVATWQAYNTWGGYDLYTGPGGYNDRSLAVSLDRPYDGKGADEFLVFERKLINLAERLGLPLAYTTSMDLDRDPHLLDKAARADLHGSRRVLVAARARACDRGQERRGEHRVLRRQRDVQADQAGRHPARRPPARHLLQDQLPAGPDVRQAQRPGDQRLA